MLEMLFIAVALVAAVVISAIQYGTDSRDWYGDDHQRVAR